MERTLGNRHHLKLLMEYVQTGDPAAFDELRTSLSVTPGRARIEEEEKRLIGESNLGKLLVAVGGKEAGRYLTEAADPLELGSMAIPTAKLVRMMKAFRAGRKVKAGAMTGTEAGPALLPSCRLRRKRWRRWRKRKAGSRSFKERGKAGR